MHLPQATRSDRVSLDVKKRKQSRSDMGANGSLDALVRSIPTSALPQPTDSRLRLTSRMGSCLLEELPQDMHTTRE